MNFVLRKPTILALLTMLPTMTAARVVGQDGEMAREPLSVTVSDTTPPQPVTLAKGPDVRGTISARSGDRMQVTADNGAKTVVTLNDATRVIASKGLLGLNRSTLSTTSLLTGLPVIVTTLESSGGLVASQIKVQNKDLKTARMIHTGTDQRFAEQTAATQALRDRMADIDKYNIKGTMTVTFETGKAALAPHAKDDLCATATKAEAMDNALLLVVGYTDSSGSEERNQILSEKRAARVVNYLQQSCHWKPFRMLTPTGMSEADPLADNNTAKGKAQNRRVTVNILVSKGLDGI
ncbi:MAG: OmpA family protein [Pseudomonadota bacterium]|jgi:OOP family OmpA-OmpF porin|tara:strand:+ start:27048 stop:27929 length:882 start_codon:yes stop_codon:yes gene_type:complete